MDALEANCPRGEELWQDICGREAELAARLVRGLRDGIRDEPATRDSRLIVTEDPGKAVQVLSFSGKSNLEGCFSYDDLTRMLDCGKYLARNPKMNANKRSKKAWAQFLVGRLEEVPPKHKRQKTAGS